MHGSYSFNPHLAVMLDENKHILQLRRKNVSFNPHPIDILDERDGTTERKYVYGFQSTINFTLIDNISN